MWIGWPDVKSSSLVESLTSYSIWNVIAKGCDTPTLVVIPVIIPVNPCTNLIPLINSFWAAGNGAITNGKLVDVYPKPGLTIVVPVIVPLESTVAVAVANFWSSYLPKWNWSNIEDVLPEACVPPIPA